MISDDASSVEITENEIKVQAGKNSIQLHVKGIFCLGFLF